jgi:hypothetical protein
VYWRAGIVVTVIPTMEIATNTVEIKEIIPAALEDSSCSIRSHRI